jgi:hypothetical protein
VSTACATHTCQAGTCVTEDAAQGATCGAGEYCNAGSCISACNIGGELYFPGITDPSNACLVCNPSVSATAWSPAADGSYCNDGNVCTSGDHCTSGVCGGTVVADGTTCNDGNPCTSGDQCTGGVCGGTVVADGTACDEGNPCVSSAQCTSGACVETDLANGTPCKNSNFIYGTGSCISGACFDGCYVNGQTYGTTFEPQYEDTGICGICNPSVSTTSLYVGGCHCNNLEGECNGAGVCVYQNALDGCSPDCEVCSVTQCCSGYCYGFPKQVGTPCPGSDTCHGACGNNDGICDATFPLPDGTSCGASMTCTGGVCE